MGRPGMWLNRRGGATGKLAKRPYPRKAQKQETRKNERNAGLALDDNESVMYPDYQRQIKS